MVVRLVDFLNDKQRDPRLNEILYPHYNDARVSHNHIQHHHGRGRKSHTHKILFMKFWDFGCTPPSSTSSSNNQVMEIVSKYEPDPELVAKRAIGKEGFTRFQRTRMIVMMMSRVVGGDLRWWWLSDVDNSLHSSWLMSIIMMMMGANMMMVW